ncbi:MAG: serine hydrolase domain-containing protein [Bacteriovoracia bacterium]
MRLIKTEELIESATPEVFSNSAFGVFYKGKEIFFSKNCGTKTIFDLASLTKVLCTTTLCAVLEKRKVFKRDLKIKDFFSSFDSSKVKTQHLLAHSSGFPAWAPLFEKFHGSDPIDARQLFEKEILSLWKPENFEKQIEYSDLGFMLLGWIIEKLTGETLDVVFQERVTRIFNSKPFESLRFLPSDPDIAPTEECSWRKRVLRGEVHDDNCYVLGGVAGHAGLFGNVEDVLELAKNWLFAVSDQEKVFLDPAIAKQYWQPITVNGVSRALGWDCVAQKNSAAGSHFSDQTRGHLGFTGTSLWIDPKNEVIVTLLTNRVFPTRNNDKIRAFRPIFHNTVLGELGL